MAREDDVLLSDAYADLIELGERVLEEMHSDIGRIRSRRVREELEEDARRLAARLRWLRRRRSSLDGGGSTQAGGGR